MSYTYPLAMPTVPIFRAVRFRARSRVALNVDPFAGTQQAYEWPGQWWEADVELPSMERAEAEEWIAFRLMLNGRAGTFHLGDPVGTAPRGSAPGTPLVNGANPVRSRSLSTKGWTSSQTNILRAGDWIEIGTGEQRRLYKNLKNVNSNGSGIAVLDIYPALREALSDGTTIVTSACQGTFRMADNVTEWDLAEAQQYGLGFSCIEAI